MLSLFKRKPILSDPEVQWSIDTFIWACEHFDWHYLLKHTKIIEPTGEYFPDQVNSVEQMASTVFKRVINYAGMQAWPIEWVTPANMTSHAMPVFRFKDTLRGEQAQLVAEPISPLLMSYNPNQVNQPQDLVASYAQGLALMMIYHKGVLPPGGQESVPAASDALACFLGFGVMMSNTVYQFKGGCGSCYNPYANRQSALTEEQTVFMHALVCHFLNVNTGVKHLKPHLKGIFKKAQKQLALYLNDTENPYLLAIEDQGRARISE